MGEHGARTPPPPVKAEIQSKFVAGCADASDTDIRRLVRDAAKELFPKAMFNDLLEEVLKCKVDAASGSGAASEAAMTTLKDLTVEDVEDWTEHQVWCHKVFV